MTIDVIVHDKRSNLRLKGAGGGPLGQELRARFGMICRQEGTADSDKEGMTEFKFKSYYKISWGRCEATLGCLRFEQLQSIEN